MVHNSATDSGKTDGQKLDRLKPNDELSGYSAFNTFIKLRGSRWIFSCRRVIA